MTHPVLDIVLRVVFWQGLIAYLAVSGLALWWVEYLQRRMAGHDLMLWYLERIAAPLGRAAAMAVFLLVSYPVIFGADLSMPPLSAVLSVSLHWPSQLVNVLFFSTLLLSLIPVVGEVPAFVLPVQGFAGALLLVSWSCAVASRRGCMELHYWPGVGNAMTIMLAAYIAHRVGAWLDRWLTNDDYHGQFMLARDLVRRLVSAPLLLLPVLLYGVFLGRQLAA